MKYIVDHDYHIHTELSPCSKDPEQVPINLMKYAEENGFVDLCLTDHFWDHDHIPLHQDTFYNGLDLNLIKRSLPLPKGKAKMYFGAETELSQDLVIGTSLEVMNELDFIIIPTTHMHMKGFTLKGDEDDVQRAELWKSRLDFVLSQDLPFHKIGIAHLACQLIYKPGINLVLEHINDAEYGDLFQKAAKVGVGIEINGSDFNFANKSDEVKKETLRMYQIAKECGCSFYLGSDVHHACYLKGKKEIFENAVQLLDLKEEQKFCPFKR